MMWKARKALAVITCALLMAVVLFGCSVGTPNPTSANTEPVETPVSGTETKTPASLNYPKDVIHMVVTFTAGGGNDLIARATAAAMEEVSGATVVVDNVIGGGGMTGSEQVVAAKPDGYTILCQDASLTSMFVTQECSFGLEDLTPIASVYTCPTWVLSNAERGYTELQDFVDRAKEHPGELTIGTAVTTGSQYLMGCAIAGFFDLDVTIIPYAGGNELQAAILGNQVDIGVVHSPIMLPEVTEGLVNVLAAGSSLENIGEESLKDVKTLADYGMDVTFSSTRGFFVPNDTPEEVIAYLENLFAECIDTEAMGEFSTSFGYEPTYQNREQYTKFLQDEMAGFQEIYNQLQQ